MMSSWELPATALNISLTVTVFLAAASLGAS